MLKAISELVAKLPWSMIILFCLTLGLALFFPIPHMWEKLELLSKVVFELKIKRQSGFQESPRFHQRIVHLQSPLPGNQSHVTFSNSFLHIVPA